MKNNSTYRVLGVMSGTSLDGLDLAICDFSLVGEKWEFDIVDCKTVDFPKSLYESLSSATENSGLELKELDNQLGVFIGQQCHKITQGHSVDFIASHGHTVFHQPEKSITLQIGNGQIISGICKLPVVYDFRSLDVALGGQGAPLVPLVDQLLFSDYDFCLNLGGIANISFDQAKERKAFDVVPCNMILNKLANKLNQPYDNEGKLAAEGKVIDALLNKWNELEYYTTNGPKSLGYEYVSSHYFSDFEHYDINDLLATSVEHIVGQLKMCVQDTENFNTKMLVTGGGAKNKFLISKLNEALPKVDVVIPDSMLIDFKEAVAFAFLGVKRVRGEVNVLSSVTGASRDSCSGVVVGFLG
ncbi:anhydro-N-acetylmuramic acid kinase [Fulvivirga lutea]|uniref:Anhydro-N-acetylmuramic acid kinase n=1 Tax=Fulvivirga lutea TaxID=2810512 RepID=A0A974WHP1_9BACT|nr:anhydro-N-acetylmuramic acid kinase [Fulvivirga lutea]QSE98744.1 anhydro-N-acetylmuramic acid kinase [Fulvivirga lutea]